MFLCDVSLFHVPATVILGPAQPKCIMMIDEKPAQHENEKWADKSAGTKQAPRTAQAGNGKVPERNQVSGRTVFDDNAE